MILSGEVISPRASMYRILKKRGNFNASNHYRERHLQRPKCGCRTRSEVKFTPQTLIIERKDIVLNNDNFKTICAVFWI